MSLEDIYETSNDVLGFDTDEQVLLDNKEFIMAWGIARQKANETIHLIKCLLLLKKKYNMNDFDFALLMEGFDEETLFGDDSTGT
jgi:hypothetical protein